MDDIPRTNDPEALREALERAGAFNRWDWPTNGLTLFFWCVKFKALLLREFPDRFKPYKET